MEEQKNIPILLQQIPQGGFCVKNGRILSLNQAAQALALSVGDDVAPLLHTGAEEYAAMEQGQLYLCLSLGGQLHSATVTRLDDMDLFVLDPAQDPDEFRTMALISMEMRGSLMRLVSSTEPVLRELDLSDPEKATQAGRINRSIQQLTRLACNLSDVSRYAASAHKETRDIAGFMRAIFEKAGAYAADSGITLHYDGLQAPVFGLVDPEQLERAVWNLISNSAKFLPKGGTIHASLTRKQNQLRLCIQDSGSGIAQSVRGNLFQRYRRQPSIEDNRFGLGLGLVIVRTAAANHGGTVLIESHRDSGTRVTLTLAITNDADTILRCPLLLPDYASGWDHGLLELSDSLCEAFYRGNGLMSD